MRPQRSLPSEALRRALGVWAVLGTLLVVTRSISPTTPSHPLPPSTTKRLNEAFQQCFGVDKYVHNEASQQCFGVDTMYGSSVGRAFVPKTGFEHYTHRGFAFFRPVHRHHTYVICTMTAGLCRLVSWPFLGFPGPSPPQFQC